MATTKIAVKGVATWAKVFEDNRDMEGFQGAYKEFNGGYTINVELEAEEFDKLSRSGSMKKGKVGENGMIVKFDRKHLAKFEGLGGPPKVLKPSGLDWNFEDDGIIPNGSEVIVYLSVFSTSYGTKGTRLDMVKVTEVAEMPELDKMSVMDPSQYTDEIPF